MNRGNQAGQVVFAWGVIALLATTTRADVIYVDDSATAGANTGQS